MPILSVQPTIFLSWILWVQLIKIYYVDDLLDDDDNSLILSATV